MIIITIIIKIIIAAIVSTGTRIARLIIVLTDEGAY